jgi:hypothetical protein
VVWLLYFAISILGSVLMKGVVVRGDAAATSTNLLAHAATYGAGASFDLLGNCAYIVLAIVLYGVFRKVDRNAALLATTFNVAGCITQIIGGLLRFVPFVLLRDNQAFSAFSAQQLQAAALFSLRLYGSVFSISFVLFGFFEMLLGYLILKSNYFPRWFGWLWIVAGVGATSFLWPPFATKIFPVILAFDVVELALAIWLIAKGPLIDSTLAPRMAMAQIDRPERG